MYPWKRILLGWYWYNWYCWCAICRTKSFGYVNKDIFDACFQKKIIITFLVLLRSYNECNIFLYVFASFTRFCRLFFLFNFFSVFRGDSFFSSSYWWLSGSLSAYFKVVVRCTKRISLSFVTWILARMFFFFFWSMFNYVSWAWFVEWTIEK